MRWVIFLGALLGCGGMTSGAAPAIADPPLVMSALTKCRTCHGQAGPGPEINRSAAPALSGLIADRVRSGNMPPWMPGPLSESFAGDYGLTDAERTALLAWSSAGGHLAAEIPDPAKAAYPSGPVVARLHDDRWLCSATAPGWRRVPVFRSSMDWPVRGDVSLPVGSRQSKGHTPCNRAGRIRRRCRRATTRQGKDGRPGFNCITLPADLDIVADLGASGVGPGGGQVFPRSRRGHPSGGRSSCNCITPDRAAPATCLALSSGQRQTSAAIKTAATVGINGPRWNFRVLRAYHRTLEIDAAGNGQSVTVSSRRRAM